MNDSKDIPAGIAGWLGERGYSQAERVFGGRNNRVFKVGRPDGPAALKIYYRGPGDQRDRFAAERAFYSIAQRSGVAVPRWLEADENLGVSLLSWIEGGPVTGTVSRDDALGAAFFVARINAKPPEDTAFPFVASEACFSTEDHAELLKRRIALLAVSSRGWPELGEFLDSALHPLAHDAMDRLGRAPEVDFRSLGQSRILSPGDFGLHNAKRRVEGSLVFFDFEYSGWDDPVKTVADIFLQPERPVEWDLLGEVCRELRAWPDLEKRVRAWVPFFAAKWAVILLNSAVKDASRRRVFAGEAVDEKAVGRQIAKAREVIERGKTCGV